MKSFTISALLISSLLMTWMSPSGVRGCSISSNPCRTDQCCRLVFNLRFLSFSFCLRSSANDDKCARFDYCLLNSDCRSNICEGASTFQWGRCRAVVNPCLDKIVDAAKS